MSPRFNGYDAKLRKLPKPQPTSAAVSWWTLPSYQTSREAFQAKLIASEITRMNASRFGGRGRVTDTGIKAADEEKR